MRTSSALLLAILAACSAETRRPAVPAADDAARAAVQAAQDHYIAMLKRVNSDSVTMMYTEDGELLEPGMKALSGRAAIHAFLAPFDGKTVVDTVISRTDAIEVHGSTSYLWGSYHQVARMPPQPAGTYDGRFVAKWRLEPDGQWRLARLLMQPGPSVTP